MISLFDERIQQFYFNLEMEDLKEMDTDVGVEWMKTVEGGYNDEKDQWSHHHHLLSPPEG